MMKVLKMMDDHKASCIMGHLEINGFVATRGHTMEHGMDTKMSLINSIVYTQVTIILGLIMERYIILEILMRCSGMM